MQIKSGGVITTIGVNETESNDFMIFEVRFANEEGLAEIWEPKGSAPLATVPDDGDAGEHAAKLIQSWFPGAKLD